MMKKGSNRVIGGIHEIGLQLLAYPGDLNTWTSSTGYLQGNNSFNLIDYRINGQIRIAVSGRHHLVDNFKPIFQFQSLEPDFILEQYHMEKKIVADAVVVDFTCRNMGNIMVSPKQARKIEIDLEEEEDILRNLNSEIENCIREDFPLAELKQIMNRGIYTFAVAVIFVDDLSKVIQKLEKWYRSKSEIIPYTLRESGILELPQSSTFDSLGFPHYRIGVPPLYLFLMEGDDISSWIEKGAVTHEDVKAFSSLKTHIDFLLHSNHLLLVNDQIHLVKWRCTNLLESLPEQKPDSYSEREERIEKLAGILNDISFYWSTYLLADDFLLNTQFPDAEDIPKDYKQLINKEYLEKKMRFIEKQLTLLEQDVQSRLLIENLMVNRHKEEQQERTERRVNIVTGLLGTFFIFEVFASLLSWYFLPSDSNAWFYWIPMIASSIVLIILAVCELGKTSDTMGR